MEEGENKSDFRLRSQNVDDKKKKKRKPEDLKKSLNLFDSGQQ